MPPATLTQTKPVTPAAANDPSVLIAEAIKKVTTIATLPEVTARIVATVEDPRSTASQLHKIVSHDPALVTRILKVVNSAFYGEPSLEPWLRERSITGLVICGITANQCCETTARMAGNLGFETFFALDATHAFERFDLEGVAIPAAQITRITGANLQEEFASVVSTAELLAAVGRNQRAPR